MTNILTKKDIEESLITTPRQMITEERKLPSDSYLASCPEIYKAVDENYRLSFIEAGFQHQVAGRGGEAYGPGVYAMLNLQGGLNRVRQGYGHVLLKAKLIGGFRNFIIFDANCYESIRNALLSTYKRYISPEEQIDLIVKDPMKARALKSRGRSMNEYPDTRAICYEYGIRGLIYADGHEGTVLPFDYSSVILWEVAENVSSDGRNLHFKRTFDKNARERYENGCDWTYQLQNSGRYTDFDRQVSPKVRTNGENYCVVRGYNGKFNIVQLDTDIKKFKKEVKEISDFWFDRKPTSPSYDGTFTFEYRGIHWQGTVFLPLTGRAAVWCPEDLHEFEEPADINADGAWVDLTPQHMEELWEEYNDLYNNNSSLYESISKKFRKYLNEEIKQNNEEDFLEYNQTYVYRACAPSQFPSMFNGGQLRQFAGSNDGSWYGEGVYAVIRPESVQYGKYDKETHSAGVKMIVTGGFKRFLCFDEYWAKKIYGDHYQFKDQIYALFPSKVANDLWRELSGYMERHVENCQHIFSGGCRTTGMLHVMFDDRSNADKFSRLFSKYNVRGAIYHGGNDGLAMVCWNFDEIIPFEVTTDRGQTWSRKFFNFKKAKERSILSNDPVQKYRHMYKTVYDKIVFCNVNGRKMSVTPVQTFDGGYNIIFAANGKKISPFDFDRMPLIGIDGIFNFRFMGKDFQGIIWHPQFNVAALWFPQDNMELFYDVPSVEDTEAWVGLNLLKDAVEELNNMNM